ncbi:predicted protein [Chaetoceros tenuissimus]|uniref:Uncharacterized protein n=1 Tax=Chaetoceros tenuissimus TaxID=426638 RepID=A0AAD3HAB2_9STRA|nr:predicted protein [Chaetoceros tenuissimus]
MRNSADVVTQKASTIEYQYTLFEDDAPGIAGGLPLSHSKGCQAIDYLAKQSVNDGYENGGHTYIIEHLKEVKAAYDNDGRGDLKIAYRFAEGLFAIVKFGRCWSD